MRPFDLRIRFPTGTILVGGHSAVPGGVSSTHSVDHRGRPVIPATALRGALRETLEAILRGDGRRACDSGTGIDPSLATKNADPTPCTLDGGNRCIPCRIFGTQRAAIEAGESSFSSLIVGDAVLEDEDAVELVTRPSVSVSRTHRSAENQRLFQRQSPDLTERVLVARGYSVDRELEHYLDAAARGTMHLGSGRSIGLARVQVDVVWLDEAVCAPANASAHQDDELTLQVRLQSPTALGTAEASSNYRATRTEIPGSVLRGAIGFAIARSMPKLDVDGEPFQALVDETKGAHFGFLYPVSGGDHESPRLSAPWPATARACKTHPNAHPVVDTLLDRIAVAMIESSTHAQRVHDGALRTCLAPDCTAPLRNPSGTRTHSGSPPTRVVTRVSIERRTTSARNEALFSYELLEPGTTFRGTIRNIPPTSRAIL
ncbi:MAG: RAMP superfamily CRISPR-associated protein, partial [Nannocystaceae bacterium]